MLALMVIRTASEANLPPNVRAQMMFNVAVDFVVGLIPFLGDLADMAFKANTRNAIVLENFLRERGAENLRKQGIPQQQDPSLSANYDRDEQEDIVNQQPIARPQPAYQSGGGGGIRGGFLSGLFGGGSRVDDVEAQRTGGSRSEGARHQSSRHGGSRSEGATHQSSKHGGSRSEGSRHQSSKHGGSSRHGSSRHESSRAQTSKSHRHGATGGQESGVTGSRR
jgi:Domain of unknown function (DUF4112)